jgi:hypothetical protein
MVAAMIHLQRVHITTDAPMGKEQARAIGTLIATEVNAGLKAARGADANVRVGALKLSLTANALADRKALTHHAQSIAQRILNRTPE